MNAEQSLPISQSKQELLTNERSNLECHEKSLNKFTTHKHRILISGGAGFVGSHLVDRLMNDGHYCIVIDNLYTGSKRNIQHWIGHERFEFILHDVVEPIMLQVDQIYHLACPASPLQYQNNPIKTIKTNVMGTLNMLGLAKKCQAKFLLASTSEVYGDPAIHPQNEDYWGNVNPTGPRSCYDEGKRVAESLTMAYHNQDSVNTRIVRIFNTYGPRMNPKDGRVVSNFIMQAIKKKSVTIYGTGMQTRSFQYVSDLIQGLVLAMSNEYHFPLNIGNPYEITVLQLCDLIEQKIGYTVEKVYLELPKDDPQRRKPDIQRAKNILGWEPVVDIQTGIQKTMDSFLSDPVTISGNHFVSN